VGGLEIIRADKTNLHKRTLSSKSTTAQNALSRWLLRRRKRDTVCSCPRLE
jgi:hypothetical protein